MEESIFKKINVAVLVIIAMVFYSMPVHSEIVTTVNVVQIFGTVDPAKVVNYTE